MEQNWHIYSKKNSITFPKRGYTNRNDVIKKHRHGEYEGYAAYRLETKRVRERQKRNGVYEKKN